MRRRDAGVDIICTEQSGCMLMRRIERSLDKRQQQQSRLFDVYEMSFMGQVHSENSAEHHFSSKQKLTKQKLTRSTSEADLESYNKAARPHYYRVLLLNDDQTPMEFVIHILREFFHKSLSEATRIMLQVHHQGAGICGVYSYEVAETKVTQVMDFAKKCNHPLRCIMEKNEQNEG